MTTDTPTATPSRHVVVVTELRGRPHRPASHIAACNDCAWIGRYFARADAERAKANHEAGVAG